MEIISEKHCSTYNMITKRWSIHILYVLLNSPKKFKEIHREISGISEMMLARRLKDLLKEQLIAKHFISNEDYAVYVLTEKGKSLSSFIPSLIEWSCNYLLAPGDEIHKDKEERGDGTAFV